MGTGFAKKKKQARMMQEQLSKMQSDIEHLEVTGVAGGGLVSLTLSGEYELKQIKIKPECVDPEEIGALEDLVKVAYQDALKQLKSKMSSGMPAGLPPGFGGLPF